LVARRRCEGSTPDGEPCGAPPQLDGPYCFFHDPEQAEDAALARSAGGRHRRKEATIAAIYDLEGLETVDGIRRIVQIVTSGALAREGGNQRDRVLLAACQVAMKLLEHGDHESRIEALEAALRSKRSDADAVS